MRSVRASLAWRTPAASRARGSRHAALGFASLPHAVALQIFALLPADARARAAVICRAWRAAVAEPSLWTRLDLSPASGVKRPVTDAVLRGAAALACGALKALYLEDCVDVTHDVRLEVVTANARSLRELVCWFKCAVLPAGSVEELVLAAPQLQGCAVDTAASFADAIRMLRNEAPFGALWLRSLEIDQTVNGAAVHALAAAMTDHPLLTSLTLSGLQLDLPEALDAVTAAAVSCRLLCGLVLRGCSLSPASVPALARMIRGGSLTSLHIDNERQQLLDEPAAVQLADAIAASTTLRLFVLEDVRFWDDGAAAAAVIRALTGHPSVRVLALDWNNVHDAAAAGAALGALVAANAPALQELDVHTCHLGDAGLGPLFDALPHNAHLRQLDCSNTGMSAQFARDRLLPAVRANTSLRKLLTRNPPYDVTLPEVQEAVALVAARADADSEM